MFKHDQIYHAIVTFHPLLDLAKRDEQLVEEKEARKKLNQQYKKEKQSYQHKVRELEQQLETVAKEKCDELSTALDKCEQGRCDYIHYLNIIPSYHSSFSM